jgi:8-oxo-dGTP diphosphatase
VSTHQRIAVAAAVITNDRGEFLLAQRPPGKPYSGYWEFPGGKIEPGESAPQALARELEEELGIRATVIYPWITRDHDYTHASVRLHFYRVTAWRGEIHGRERQQFAWQSVDNVTVAPLLPANAPVLRALELPPVYGITCAGEIGREAFMPRLAHALQHGLRLVQVREKTFSASELRAFAVEVVTLARLHGARVLLNGAADIAQAVGAAGVHLTAAQLMSVSRRPEVAWCGASCHNAAELERAAMLGVDFAVLGPVSPTSTHPDAAVLGWEQFTSEIRDYPLPVYAIGGMQSESLDAAWGRGAHGVALMRGMW